MRFSITGLFDGLLAQVNTNQDIPSGHCLVVSAVATWLLLCAEKPTDQVFTLAMNGHQAGVGKVFLFDPCILVYLVFWVATGTGVETFSSVVNAHRAPGCAPFFSWRH
ncbi:MAG: hypothetical protein HQL87_09815 [Magnetococcales bacterium]|nr:hypothetical protein [Magnetococcales bacterium]